MSSLALEVCTSKFQSFHLPSLSQEIFPSPRSCYEHKQKIPKTHFQEFIKEHHLKSDTTI
jgi:hypothetical protein